MLINAAVAIATFIWVVYPLTTKIEKERKKRKRRTARRNAGRFVP